MNFQLSYFLRNLLGKFSRMAKFENLSRDITQDHRVTESRSDRGHGKSSFAPLFQGGAISTSIQPLRGYTSLKLWLKPLFGPEIVFILKILELYKACFLFVCVEVLRPSQPIRVMSSVVRYLLYIYIFYTIQWFCKQTDLHFSCLHIPWRHIFIWHGSNIFHRPFCLFRVGKKASPAEDIWVEV